MHCQDGDRLDNIKVRNRDTSNHTSYNAEVLLLEDVSVCFPLLSPHHPLPHLNTHAYTHSFFAYKLIIISFPFHTVSQSLFILSVSLFLSLYFFSYKPQLLLFPLLLYVRGFSVTPDSCFPNPFLSTLALPLTFPSNSTFIFFYHLSQRQSSLPPSQSSPNCCILTLVVNKRYN